MTDPVPGTRVTFFLPVNDINEQLAAEEALSLVRDTFRGSTHTPFDAPPFIGYWIDDETNTMFLDLIAWLMVDTPTVPNHPDLVTLVDELKRAILDAYGRAGSTQAERWVILHPISRLV